ncbi:MAG: FAD-binding oxidoreductase [Promethearchaeota archaeon]
MALNGIKKWSEPQVGSLTEFINSLLKRGFVKKCPPLSLNLSKSSTEKKGYWLLVNNAILGYTLRDCSFLNISPAVICQPRTLSQLQDIVIAANQEHIPLTFAGGKTGLSGGFATPYVLIDLEHLQTLDKPVTYNPDDRSIKVDQNVLVSYLIRYAEIVSESHHMFPSQPASAFKLPVRVGGLISTNASGVIAGKFGPIADWVLSMQIMTPTGEIRTVSKLEGSLNSIKSIKSSELSELSESSLFEEIIGGMGYNGIILNAHIKLAPAPPLENVAYMILYGDDYHSIFQGLQEVQNQKVFALNSEFIIGPEGIPGIFAAVDSTIKVKWAILLKDEKPIVEKFAKIARSSGPIKEQFLSSIEYQKYIEERAALAIQTKSNDPNTDYIRFPGFEDLLMPPGTLGPVFDNINNILPSFGFPSIFVGYGHLNFRKGQGLLLHIRIPVNISHYAADPVGMQAKIARVTAEMNYLLENEYKIRPKAEHSTGMFLSWHQRSDILQILEKTLADEMFLSPHLVIFLQICADFQIDLTQPWNENQSKQVLERLMVIYLSGKYDIKQKIN